MNVRFNRAALADISEIIEYMEVRDRHVAIRLLSRFEAAAKLIGRMPMVGATTERANFRRLVVGNYLIVYEIIKDEAIIQYVRHGARKRPWEPGDQ